MKAFRILFFFVMGAIVLQSCQTGSSDKVMLRLQPEEGAEYNCEIQVDAKIKMMGMNVTSDMMMAYRMVAETVTEDTITFSTIYDRIKMDQEMPMMGEVSYDTDTRDDTTKEMGMMEKQYDNIFGKMVGKQVTIKMSPLGQLVGSSGMEGLFQGTDQEMAEQANIAEQISSMTAVFSEKEVGVGDTWEASVSTAGQVPMVTNNTYTVKKVTESEVELDVKGTVTFDTEAPGAQQIGSAEVSGDVAGTITVDRATGWTKRAELTQNVTAKLAQAGGQPMDMENKITLTTK